MGPLPYPNELWAIEGADIEPPAHEAEGGTEFIARQSYCCSVYGLSLMV
ncbi:hypothetical protein COCOBI_pt-0360 (chloroplast) [Coccomyxa sp. Obi]|nr:hypothetical protein COCOBI_pt-0360 [Coccomyxa sp. Obi]